MSSDPPSKHDYRVLCGMSCEVRCIIQGSVPLLDLDCCRKTSYLAARAKFHRDKLTVPMVPSVALDKVLYTRRIRRVRGLISLPGSIVHGIFGALYHLAQREIALSRLSHERKKVESDVLDEILESLCASLELILKMLLRLGLETSESLKPQMHDSRYLLLLTLARLLEAYGSRFAPAGTIYLASQKVLPREYCSGIAKLHFDQVSHLKDDLISAGFRSTNDLDFAQIEVWFPKIWQALNGSFVEEEQDPLFCNLLQTLRNTCDELPGLLLPA